MKRYLAFLNKPAIIFCVLVSVAFIFPQCKKQSIAYVTNINGNDVVICPVYKVTDTVQLSLSSLIDSCKIVKLQSLPEGLIDNPWFTVISKDYICIKTHGQLPAKLFDINGKFVRNIGSIGRGPGEYSTLYGLQFSPGGDMLFMLPFGTTRKIIAYDTSGNHLNDIPLVFTQRKFKAFFSPDSIITVISMPFAGDSVICYQQTYDGKLIQKISPPSYLINQSFDGEIFTNYLTPEYDFFNTAVDTLYHYNIEKNTLEPEFAKDFGNARYITISWEIPGYYYFYFYNKDSPSQRIIVDKLTLDAKYLRLRNDFFGNIEMPPVFSNGYFINNIAAITLKNQIEKALKLDNLSESDRNKLIEFNNDLKSDDNNIIFYGKLKRNRTSPGSL